jgi:hypothetical protein
MVEDDVEDDAQALLMRRRDQLDQIGARAEARVDLEEVLDAVAVIAVEMRALLEHRAEPEGAHAETLQVGQAGADAGERAALEPLLPRARPRVPAPARGAGVAKPAAIERRTLGRVAEAVDQQEVEHLVPPVDRRREIRLAPRQPDVLPDARRARRRERGVRERHGIPPLARLPPAAGTGESGGSLRRASSACEPPHTPVEPVLPVDTQH